MGIHAKLFVALVMLTCASTAEASFYNGNDVYQWCESENYFDKGRLHGLVAGMVDSSGSSNTNYRELLGFKWCLPDSVQMGQMTDITCKWLKENPQLRHYAVTGLMASAFEEAFPCP